MRVHRGCIFTLGYWYCHRHGANAASMLPSVRRHHVSLICLTRLLFIQSIPALINSWWAAYQEQENQSGETCAVCKVGRFQLEDAEEPFEVARFSSSVFLTCRDTTSTQLKISGKNHGKCRRHYLAPFANIHLPICLQHSVTNVSKCVWAPGSVWLRRLRWSRRLLTNKISPLGQTWTWSLVAEHVLEKKKKNISECTDNHANNSSWLAKANWTYSQHICTGV